VRAPRPIATTMAPVAIAKKAIQPNGLSPSLINRVISISAVKPETTRQSPSPKHSVEFQVALHTGRASSSSLAIAR
jgi:hypothetical protein